MDHLLIIFNLADEKKLHCLAHNTYSYLLINPQEMKKHFLTILLTALTIFLFAQDKDGYKVYWNSGLRAESSDGDFKIKIGGRIQTDAMFINQDDSLNNNFDASNGVEFRRARLYVSGTLYKNVKFKFQVDFADGSAVIKDAYMQFAKIPVIGNLRVGNFKEPSGLSMLTSSKYITMMERPLGNAFDNDRNTGLMINNQHINKRLSWYAGYFYPTDNSGKYVGNKYNLVFRLTGLPVYNTDNGFKVLHLGASYTYQFHDNQEFKFSVRPEAHLAPKYLSVTIDALKNVNDLNTEFLYIYNSLSLEAEYTYTNVFPGIGSTLQKSSYAVYAWHTTLSWFVTGEHKNYDKSKTLFDIVKPKKNLGQDGGFGALELALRYSSIDLNNEDFKGGQLNDITAGINWYMNPAARVSFNYINADVVDLGRANIFQMRFQIVF